MPASEPAADALPVELDGLASWAVGDRLLRDRLAGHDRDRCRQAEWRRGELPPGALGDTLLTGVLEEVEPLVAAAVPARGEPLPDVDVDVALPDGRRLVGTLGGLYRGAGRADPAAGGVLPAGARSSASEPGSGCSR